MHRLALAVLAGAVALGSPAFAGEDRNGWHPYAGARPRVDGAVGQIYNGVPTAGFEAVAGLLFHQSDGGLSVCSGTLISPSVVLTAAHCVLDTIGAVAAFFPDGNELDYDAAGYDVHPAYDGRAVADIALLTLTSPVTEVAPLPLAARPPRAGRSGTIVGFGQDETGRLGTKQVGTVKLRACPRAIPAAGIGRGQLATSLCWRPKRNGQDTCHGDSGGPLLVGGAVSGVTSGGFPECPGLWSWDTSVARFASWIRAALF